MVRTDLKTASSHEIVVHQPVHQQQFGIEYDIVGISCWPWRKEIACVFGIVQGDARGCLTKLLSNKKRRRERVAAICVLLCHKIQDS